jgi:hypothetical protein
MAAVATLGRPASPSSDNGSLTMIFQSGNANNCATDTMERILLTRAPKEH